MTVLLITYSFSNCDIPWLFLTCSELVRMSSSVPEQINMVWTNLTFYLKRARYFDLHFENLSPTKCICVPYIQHLTIRQHLIKGHTNICLQISPSIFPIPGCAQTVAMSNLKLPNNLLPLRMFLDCNTCQFERNKKKNSCNNKLVLNAWVPTEEEQLSYASSAVLKK